MFLISVIRIETEGGKMMTLSTSLLNLFTCLIISGGVITYMLILQKISKKKQEEKEDIETNSDSTTVNKIENEK